MIRILTAERADLGGYWVWMATKLVDAWMLMRMVSVAYIVLVYRDGNVGYMNLMVTLSQSSSTTSSPYICSSMSSSLDAAPSVAALS